jgi:hypothetical protein
VPLVRFLLLLTRDQIPRSNISQRFKTDMLSRDLHRMVARYKLNDNLPLKTSRRELQKTCFTLHCPDSAISAKLLEI